MSSTRTIYLSEEVNNQLKNVKNISGLISDLLTVHFRTKFVDVDKVESMNIMEIRNKKQVLLDALTSPTTTIGEMDNLKLSIKVLEEKEKEMLKTEEQKKEEIEKKKEKHREIQKRFLKEWFIIEDEEILDLLLMYETEKDEYKNLFDWGVSKGLKTKAEEEEE